MSKNAQTSNNDNLFEELRIAIHESNYKNFKEVSDSLSEKFNFSQQDKDGNTLLHLAITNGCTAICGLLLDKGAADDTNINSYLKLAIVNGHKDVIKVFFEKFFKDEWEKAQKIASKKLKTLGKGAFKVSGKEHGLKNSFIYINGILYLKPRGLIIGKGGFGKVRPLIKRDGEVVTQKSEKNSLDVSNGELMMPTEKFNRDREIIILKMIKTYVGMLPIKVYVDRCGLHMIKERYIQKFIPGKNLRELLDTHQIHDEKTKLRIAYYAMSSIHTLHELGIIHGDIKPSNFLVHISPSGKIDVAAIDFGTSQILENGKDVIIAPTIGTPGYTANELSGKEGQYSKASDVYALGKMLKEDLKLDYWWIDEMIKKNPNERISLDEAIRRAENPVRFDPEEETIKKSTNKAFLPSNSTKIHGAIKKGRVTTSKISLPPPLPPTPKKPKRHH